MSLTVADIAMLRQIADAEPADVAVTWTTDLAGRISYRLWSDDEHYETVTPRLKRLVAAGLVRRETGWQHGRGYIETTTDGRAALAESETP